VSCSSREKWTAVVDARAWNKQAPPPLSPAQPDKTITRRKNNVAGNISVFRAVRRIQSFRKRFLDVVVHEFRPKSKTRVQAESNNEDVGIDGIYFSEKSREPPVQNEFPTEQTVFLLYTPAY